MTKNGSNSRKARVRDRATRSGKTYQQAARAIDDGQAEKELIRQRLERFDPEDLADRRECYLLDVAEADLPDSSKVCLYALSERFGTGRLMDPMGVRCTMTELAGLTGLEIEATCLSVALAQSHGWTTPFHDNEARLSVPHEDISLWEHFLNKHKSPITDPAIYGRIQESIRVNEAEQAARRASAKRLREAHGW
ncbi:hypothetical protein [Streptomyces venezuelae]|uniref:hypothetical protein n=1 Tax=Streptomyces venezuelae TaxID=54571 RepID=UPI00343EE3D6